LTDNITSETTDHDQFNRDGEGERVCGMMARPSMERRLVAMPGTLIDLSKVT